MASQDDVNPPPEATPSPTDQTSPEGSQGPSSPTPEQVLAAKKLEAVKTAWSTGYLKYKLFPYQRSLREKFYGNDGQIFVVKCSRRIGKSHWLVTTALEWANAHPGSQIKYAAADAKAVIRIIRPLLDKLLADCPEHLLPKINWNIGEIRFPNKSVIQIAGCDEEKKADALRGTDADLVIIDEAGYIPILKYVVQDVLMPQLLTTGGKMLVASSPAKVIGHFFSDLYRSAEAKLAAVKLTIWDAFHQGNPFLTEARIAEMCKDVGGEESTAWLREFLAEDVTDASMSVVPSWSEKIEKEVCQEFEVPRWSDRYVSMDPGTVDGCGILYGFWDSATAKLYIQDEDLFFHKNTEFIAKSIRAKEEALWPDDKPYMRISDNDLGMIYDLQQLHGLTFIATRKDDKELQCNNLDVLLRNLKVVIHPRCVQLKRQLYTTVWNRQRTQFERVEDPVTGNINHGDLVDALVYLVRNVHRQRNNAPLEYLNPETHRIPVNYPRVKRSQAAETFHNFFLGDD